ncbi:hypothetical protein HZ326_21210 [Fusarium oxysporum f. sp. albedinis]|nr:hypothetical protein HZ326_21210 [Fusarium oxysporum f. sp. albedinis]
MSRRIYHTIDATGVAWRPHYHGQNHAAKSSLDWSQSWMPCEVVPLIWLPQLNVYWSSLASKTASSAASSARPLETQLDYTPSFSPSNSQEKHTPTASLPCSPLKKQLSFVVIIIETSIVQASGRMTQTMLLSVWVRMGLRALDTLPLGLGRTVGCIVRSKSYLDDPKGTARKFWATGKYNAAPNGSLMRTYALGIMCLSKSVEETFQIAADFSVATHVGPRCVVFCAIGTTLVRGLVLDDVYQERRVDELIETGLTWYNERREKELQHAEREDEPCLDAAEFRQHATAQTLADLKLDESYKIGYVYNTFGSRVLLRLVLYAN